MMSEGRKELLIDQVTPPQLPSNQQLKQWASSKRVFISSTMDDLVDVRERVAQAVEGFGANPVLFETLGARSDDSRQAYTGEVRRSQIYLGLLSRRYGTKLPSGYSATHEEYEVAREHGKEILLFLDSTVPGTGRDGHLNRWLKELYEFHVLSKYDSLADLIEKVKTSLEEIAKTELTPWVKLDQAIFQASKIERATQGQLTSIRITTRTQDPRVIVEINRLAQQQFRANTLPLTFRREAFDVKIESTKVTLAPLGDDSFVLSCKSVEDQHQKRNALPLIQMRGSYTSPSGSYQYRELAEIALRCLVLAEEPPADIFFKSLPRFGFERLFHQYGDDTRMFLKIVELLLVEAIHQHGILDKVLSISTRMVKHHKLRVELSGVLLQGYWGEDTEIVKVEGELAL